MESGSTNIALGSPNGGNLISGSGNTLLGSQVGVDLISGSNNTLIGIGSGTSYVTGTESDNILLNNGGVNGENNIMRLGADPTILKSFIAGVFQVTPDVATNQLVVIDSNGQLGSVYSGFEEWQDIGSGQLFPNINYFATSAATYDLPTAPVQGDTVWVVALVSGVILNAPNSETIRVSAGASSAGGTATSTAVGNTLKLVYRATTTSWWAAEVTGTWTLA